MSAPDLWGLQAALYTHLTTIDELTSLLAQGANSIFDHVPAGSDLPYISIGELRTRPFDTQQSQGMEVQATIHSYARGKGSKDLKNIMTMIRQSLHYVDFAVTGQSLILCQETESDIALDADGETRHGVQRFRIIIEEL